MNKSDNETKNSSSDHTKDQRQLQEFNEWLVKWNNYQDLLAKYWNARSLQAHQALLHPVGEAAAMPTFLDRWDFRFQELCEYKREHGNCNVSSSFVSKYKPPLGVWVKRMRRLHKAGKLDQKKVTRLSQIGFEFVQSDTPTIKFNARWNACFLHLKAYKEKHGNLEVPNGYRPVPGAKQLDQWILRQRRLFKEDKIPKALIKKLECLGLNLKGRGRPYGYESSESWEQSYHELSKYHEKFGHTDVPEVFQSNLPLGAWVKRQRELYKMGALHEDRIQKLSTIGFLFLGKEVASSLDQWSTRVSELKAFKEANGHVDVPRSYALNSSLGIWVQNQRLAHAGGELSESQIETLDDLGFDFTLKSGRTKPLKLWERNFHELVKHRERNGSFNPRVLSAENPKIADWLRRQKRYYREKRLTHSRIDRLKELGVTFKEAQKRKAPHKASWDAQYKALLEFKNEHGDINVPSVYPPNQSLYYWICTQRAYFKRNKLSAERFQLLHTIGFDFSASTSRERKEETRKEKFLLNPVEFDSFVEKLVAYKNKYGNTNVPQQYETDRLGSFVHCVRIYQKTGKLSADQVVKLREIGFDFNVQDSLWNTRCEELASYKEKHGDFFVPYSDYPALHLWKDNQIRRYNENMLSEDQRDKLEDIGFDFVRGPTKSTNSKASPKKTTQSAPRELPIGARLESEPSTRDQYLQALWVANYEKCAAVVKETGNCDIPLKYEADPSLGAWCFAQRMAFKKNKLSEDRLLKLLELGFKFTLTSQST